MANTFREAIGGVRRQLIEAVRVSDLLLVDLRDKGVLTDDQYRQLLAVDSNERQQRAIRLIDILWDCEDALFPSCCEALITDGQQLIVDNYLRRNGAAGLQQPGNEAAAPRRYPTLMRYHTFEDAFARVRSELQKKLDVSYGLLTELQRRHVLLPGHIQTIQAQPTEYDRADSLMNLLLRRSDAYLPQFYDALMATDQKHVVHLMNFKESLQVHLEFVPPVERPKEEEFSDLLTQAGQIVSAMKTPQSTITAVLKRLRQNLTALEKDQVREELKREISTALEVGGIPPGMIHAITMVFVNLSMNDIELVYAEPGESVVLYLRCLSVVALRRIREMVLSGLLLRLFSEAVKQFIQRRPRVDFVHFDAETMHFNSRLQLLCFTLLIVCIKWRRNCKLTAVDSRH